MLEGIVSEWRSLPLAARRYIAYMSLWTPILFTWILVPYLMLETGLSVVEAGAILSAASACASALSYLMGRYLDRAEPVTIIAAIGVVEGLAYLAYYLGFSYRSVALIVTAAVVERLARGLYVAFPIYEYEAYPEDRRERAFMLHNLVPYSVQLATYPALGLAIASLDLEGQIRTLLTFSAASIAIGIGALRALPRVGVRELGIGPRIRISKLPRGLLAMTMAIMLLGIGVELTPTLALTYLLISISRNPLLALALYEALAAIPMVAASAAMLEARIRRGSLALLTGMSMLAIGDAVLSVARSQYVALSVALIESLGFALMDPFFMKTLYANIPRERRGEILGAISSMRRLLCIAGPAIAGALASLDPHTPFAVAATAIAIVTAVTYREVKHVESSSKPRA